MDRRTFIAASASWSLLNALARSDAFAATMKPDIERWLRDLRTMCGDLKAHRLTPLQWQTAIAELYSQVSLDDVLRLIDFDKLMRGVQYPPNMAAIKYVPLPAIEGMPDDFGHKIFALQKGKAIIPHVHNDTVSAHFIVKGSFHVRTYQRVFEREVPSETIYLKPSIDDHMHAGQLLTMSDDADNGHWLIAESDTAATFDVPVWGLGTRAYPTPGNDYNMIFIDPRGAPDTTTGLIAAPIIATDKAFTTFG